MNTTTLKRLFGDSGDVGNGPSRWTGGDAFQTRKVHRCEVHNRHYSVEEPGCPFCRAERTERYSMAQAELVRQHTERRVPK